MGIEGTARCAPLVFSDRFVRGSAGIDVSFSGSNEAVGTQFREEFPHLRSNRLLPEDVENFFLRELKWKDAATMFVFDFEDHEGTLHRNDIAHLTLVEFVGDSFQRWSQFAFR